MNNTLEWYAGTLNKTNHITLFLELWNNRFGDVTVPDFSNFNINLFFEYEEDKVLLDACKIYVNNKEVDIQKVDNYGVISMESITLSGEKNNGLEKDSLANFCTIKFELLSTENKKFKPADLKNLYFEIAKL